MMRVELGRWAPTTALAVFFFALYGPSSGCSGCEDGADGDLDSDADSDSDNDAEPDADGSDGDADHDADADLDVAIDGDTEADADCDPETAADGDIEADDGSIDADADPEPDVEEEEPLGPEGSLCVNEIMAANAFTIRDDADAASDWIELANPTDTDFVLDGFGITDDLADPLKHVLSGGLVLPAHGTLLLWADGTPELGPAHLGFRLGQDGEEVGLARPDGRPLDRVVYGRQSVDFSAARQPDCSDSWAVVWNVTPGASNGEGPGAPLLPEDPRSPPETAPGVLDMSTVIYSEDEVQTFDIVLSPEAITALTARPFEYVEGSITFQGRTLGPVGIRLKGQGSFLPLTAKAGFIVNLNLYVENGELFDVASLTFNNMRSDPTMMHDHMAYWVARTNGLTASRQGYAMVSVNGVVYGLYSNLESVGPRMLSRWFEDDSGSLFEAWDVEMTRAYVERFEHESGPDDRTLLYALADALAIFEPGGRPADGLAAASEYANLDSFRLYWAVCSMVGQFDSMPYSVPGDDYHIYGDPVTAQFWFIPWGMDESFGQPTRRVEGVNGLLARNCLAVTTCRDAFRDRVWTVLDTTTDAALAEHDRTAAMIAPFVALDPRKPYSNEAVMASQTAMRDFIAGRPAFMATQFPRP
jgi:hypothetical protein